MEWQPIKTAPQHGEYLVRGGHWEGEVNGPDYDEIGPWLVQASPGRFVVKGTDAYSAWVNEPTEWAKVPK
ncbi:MAG TPA: hypothetical protein DD397_06615 [Hyphomonas sp.]|jgi:hypothetical protein|uniref:hypothetical protein n=1 Tax=Hyphomonas sp. TaxID=87 RepID=UPI000E8587DD|nr:hypothetical protein [Hyphomonas sp.]QDP49115.1 MAG: hypothetical protein Unbinned4811contig1001_60 [Prokaryotic dsDNA virus sp.]HBN92218.1 hypothetical protein [Hyphomonas sp.]